jgi:hypothetical protein
MVSLLQFYYINRGLSATGAGLSMFGTGIATTVTAIGRVVGYGCAVGGGSVATFAALYLLYAAAHRAGIVPNNPDRGYLVPTGIGQVTLAGSAGFLVAHVASSVLGFKAAAYGVVLSTAVAAVAIPLLSLYNVLTREKKNTFSAPDDADFSPLNFEPKVDLKTRIYNALPSRDTTLKVASVAILLGISGSVNASYALGLF